MLKISDEGLDLSFCYLNFEPLAPTFLNGCFLIQALEMPSHIQRQKLEPVFLKMHFVIAATCSEKMCFKQTCPLKITRVPEMGVFSASPSHALNGHSSSWGKIMFSKDNTNVERTVVAFFKSSHCNQWLIMIVYKEVSQCKKNNRANTPRGIWDMAEYQASGQLTHARIIFEALSTPVNRTCKRMSVTGNVSLVHLDTQ